MLLRPLLNTGTYTLRPHTLCQTLSGQAAETKRMSPPISYLIYLCAMVCRARRKYRLSEMKYGGGGTPGKHGGIPGSHAPFTKQRFGFIPGFHQKPSRHKTTMFLQIKLTLSGLARGCLLNPKYRVRGQPDVNMLVCNSGIWPFFISGAGIRWVGRD